ncbi:T9SS type A sorting domain-containing protein [Psychroserpens damuponensis]|uniref:T9SS type A sorting domain-containing protein n=1 Tax=Psychroserpens damuponensis TaxID=943936 RepID=UPI000591686F|nr:T9SS type A sorting domain-containing protein [Psychroserpens damuponensis]
MKKNYTFKFIGFTILLILLSNSVLAQVNDENFDALTPALRGLDFTTNGIRFQQISPNSISQMASLSESSDFIITPSTNDLGLLYNIDNSGTVSGPNIGVFDYRLGSADGSEFKIVSMEADMSAKPSANGYVFIATITGYRNGASIISDNIDFTISDTSNSVTYTKDANPAANGGTLTFSSAWENIDEIRFTGGTPTGSISLLMIDELDFSIPVLSASENAFDENIAIYPNPTQDVINMNFGNIKNIDLKIFNVLGEIVYEKRNITEALYQLKLNQPSGIYFVQLNTIDKQRQIKIIKK